MKKLLLSIAVLGTIALCSGQVMAATFMNIGTGSTGGTFYPVGVILANYFNKDMQSKGIKFTAQTSGGTTENLEMLRGKEVPFAVCGGVPTANAYAGRNNYKGKAIKNIRFVTALWPEAVQLMYRQGTGIEKLADFKGKKVAVGPAAGGGVIYMPMILDAVGLSFDDLKVEYLGYGDSVQAMQNRLIDACYLASGIPTSAVSQLYAGQVDIGMIEFTDEEVAKVQAVAPYMTRLVIPKGTYNGQEKPYNVIGMKSALVTRDDVDADIVYNALNALYKNYLEEIKSQHGALKSLSLQEAIKGLADTPLHPGAVKFYKEQGVEIPASLVPPEM